MPILVQCPSCAQGYKVSDEWAGFAVRCKACGHAIEVPPPYSAPMGYGVAPPDARPLVSPPRQKAPVARPQPAPTRPPRRDPNRAFVISACIGAGCALVLALGMAIYSFAFRHRPPAMVARPADAWAAPAWAAPGGPAPEAVAKDFLAACNDINNALAAVVDANSARSQSTVVLLALKRAIPLAAQLDDSGWNPDDTHWLRAQIEASTVRLKNEVARINALPETAAVLRHRLGGDSLEHQIASLAARSRRRAQMRGARSRMGQAMAALDAPMPPGGGIAANQMVEVVVEALPVGLFSFINERLVKIAGATMLTGNGSGEMARITLGPVSDVRAFAARIDFGTVTKIDEGRRTIYVRADPAKMPKPLAPEVTNPLAADFYRQNLADLGCWEKDRRRKAAERLKEAQPKELRREIAAALLNLLTDTDTRSRTAAIKALPVWATADKAVPLLLDVLGDTDHSIKEAAMEALGEFQDARAVEPILRQAKHNPFAVEKAIRRIGEPAEPVLIEHLADADPDVCKQAIRMLGEVGTQKCLAALQKLSLSSDFFIRTDAERALRNIRDRRAEPQS